MQQFSNQAAISTEGEGETEFARILSALSMCINKYSEVLYAIEAKVSALKSPGPSKRDDMPHPLRPISSPSDEAGTVTAVFRSELERFFELNEVAYQVFCRFSDIV